MVVSSRETLLQGNSFEVINPFTGNTVFDTGDKKNLKFQPGTKIRSEGGVEVSKVQYKIRNETLQFLPAD